MLRRNWFRVGWLTLLAGLGVAQGCSGGSEAGAPAGGTRGAPGGGWLVAVRFDAGQEGVNVFPAGATGQAPVQSVAGANVLGAIPGAGIAYGRDAGPLGYAELGFFRAGDARRIVLGAQAGHGYNFVTDASSATPFLAGDRLMVAEATGASGVSLLSFARDGGDPRTLTTGACIGIFGPRMRAGGIAFNCDPETTYFSDGVAPAVALGASAAGSIPVEIAAVGSRQYVLLLTSASRLVTMPADGSNTFEFLSPDPSGTDVLLAMAGSTALVTTAVSATEHNTYTVSADASSRKVRRTGGAGPAVSGSPAVAPDHRHFLVIYRNDVGAQSRAFLVPVDPGDDVSVGLPTPSSTDSALDATQFADGTLLLKLAGSGYRAVSATGDAGPLLDASTADLHRADAGRYAVFQGSVAPFPMKAVSQDGLETVLLTTAGNPARPPLVSPSGRIFFLDGSGLAWVVAPGLSTRTLVDATPGEALLLTGGDGTREFLAVRHAAGDRATFLLHTDTGQVEKVPAGATDDVGWFLP